MLGGESGRRRRSTTSTCGKMTGARSSGGIQGSRNGRALIMTYVIVDAVLGLLIGAVCLSIPQLVRLPRQRPAI